MRTKNKRFFAAGLIVLLLAGLLSGCGGLEAPSGNSGTEAAAGTKAASETGAAHGTEPAPTEPAPTEPAASDPLRVYTELVREKEAELGAGSLRFDELYYMDGLGYLKLTDLDGDGTEELLLAYGGMFQSTLEVYAAHNGEAKLLYQGPALQWGVDGCCVEIWEDDAGRRYLPVNKGDYYDGVLSFLALEDGELREARTLPLAEAWDSELHQAEADSLNFGSIEDEENEAWVRQTQDRLADVRSRLGLAAEGPEPGPDGAESLLVQDELVTVVCLGKRMLRMHGEDRPAYLLRVTNNSGLVLDFMNGNLEVMDGVFYGEADGARLVGLYFTKRLDPEPERYEEEGIDLKLQPHSDTELYMMPLCAGTGIQTLEELVKVSAKVHVSYGTGDSFQYRNYVLKLSQDETAPALPEGRQDCVCRYFSFSIPAAWQFEISGEAEDYGYAMISVPQAWSDRGFSYISIQYDRYSSAAEAARIIAEFYLSDNASQGNYSVSSYETQVDGRTLRTVEVVGKASDNRFRFYYLDLPDGNTLTITTSAELQHEDALRADYEAFLDSIRFR